MPRFQIFVGQLELQKAASFLVLVHGMSPEAAMEYLNDLLTVDYKIGGEPRYTFWEGATGEDIFKLKKKYRVLFGQGVQIKKVD